MPRAFSRLALVASVVFTAAAVTATKAAAQSYPIDCAILLCLSGGWPASAPCARARAEFIRRITPWPVEPPLQIWRCPMGVSHRQGVVGSHRTQLYDIALRPISPPPASIVSGLLNEQYPEEVRAIPPLHPLAIAGSALQLVQGADIDISGPEFDFVRSIRLYDVRHAQQYNAGREGACERAASVVLGTYGTQGTFSWKSASPDALPSAHVGLESWGLDCPRISHRSVFVEWRDSEGRYGFEQINY